jgi:hypothetical protein
VGYLVGVDDRPSQVDEIAGNGRFPGTDPARDDNSFHLTTVATACDIAR